MTPQQATVTATADDVDSSGCAGYLQGIVRLVFVITMLLGGSSSFAADQSAVELNCPAAAVQSQYSSSGVCASPDGMFPGIMPDGGALQQLLTPLPEAAVREAVRRTATGTAGMSMPAGKKIIVYFFWGKECPHCKEERQFLDRLQRVQPSLEIRDYEVWHNRKNAGLMAAMLQARGVQSSGVPVTFIGDQLISGFTEQVRLSIGKAIENCSKEACGDPGEVLGKTGQPKQQAQAQPFSVVTSTKTEAVRAATAVSVPFLGDLDSRNSSLPLLTLIIAGMDSFNPCAFFVLLSLLGLLVHAQSRKKMLLIGGIFVFFSAFIYFLFMAAWLNLFLVMGHVAVITMIAGTVSLLIAGINIKDFFLFKQGVSLTIPDSAKPKLFDRMRKLLRSGSLVSIMVGAIVLAVAANAYELLCTAGFPMVFTRILTLNKLSTATYYLYLVLYNIVYVIPMFIIVLGFTYTLGKRQLSEWQGRVLKLISGSMMLGLGCILLINPALLNSVLVSSIILMLALAVSFLVAMVTKRLKS